MIMRIGFIGVGTMGEPMARHLQKAGHDVVIYTRRATVAERFAQDGFGVAQTIADIARDSEAIHLCVTDDAALEACVLGETGIIANAKADTLVADHSTVSPYTTRRLAKEAEAAGIAYLDAPISGGPMGAKSGTLTVMVGGEEAAFIRMRPLLETFGKNVKYLGASGSGNVAKLANNLLIAVTGAGLAEAFVLATKMGVDPQGLYDVLSTSSGNSDAMHRTMPKFTFQRNFSPAFTIDLLHKDVKLATDVGRQEGIRLLAVSLAEQIFQEARAEGLGSLDISAVIVPLERQNHLEVKPKS